MLSCCLNSSAYEKWGFLVQKYNFKNLSISFFKSNKKKVLIKINLICFLAVVHTLIKNVLYYKEINNALYIQKKKQNKMLSFNPILSQSRATQSERNVWRGLFLLTPSLGEGEELNVWPSFMSLFATLALSERFSSEGCRNYRHKTTANLK